MTISQFVNDQVANADIVPWYPASTPGAVRRAYKAHKRREAEERDAVSDHTKIGRGRREDLQQQFGQAMSNVGLKNLFDYTEPGVLERM